MSDMNTNETDIQEIETELANRWDRLCNNTRNIVLALCHILRSYTRGK